MEEPIPLVEVQVIKVTELTCLGINNEGYLRYDYYHEDLGQNDTVGQTHVYNGYDSVLWNNFVEAFPDKIQQTYASWRSGDSPLLSYDNIIKYFITNQSDKWSISIYNEDAEYKYISLYRNNDNPEFLYQVKGTGEEHLKYFIKNRLMYCDSKWHTGDFINKDTNTILMRLNSPDGIEDEEIQPDMTIRFKTFSNMYTGVRYGTNGVLNSKYTNREELVEITMPDGEDPNNLDTYIFGANEISELADLSLLYPNLLNLSAANKLTKVIIGNNHPNYKNEVLKNLSFSNNRLLKEVNICNCTGLTSIIDFSLCPDIQYIYATGSKISGVQLPDSGFLKILHLPDTINNITLVNQHHIEDFKCDGYSNLTTIKIENSENIPVRDILLGCDTSVLASVYIKNINWNVDSEENLRIIIDKLIACKGSVIDGSVYLSSGITVSDDLKVIIHQNFPNLNVIDDNPVFYIDYYNYDNTIWDTEMVAASMDAVGPAKGNPDDIIQETQGLRHLFIQWKTLPTNVNKNHQVDATWKTQYAIKYYNEDELLYSYWADQGSTAKDPIDYGNVGLDDTISIPEKDGTDDLHYLFDRWDNLSNNINKSVTIYAVFANVYPVRYYVGESLDKLHYTQWVKDGSTAFDPVVAEDCGKPESILLDGGDRFWVFSNWDNIPTSVTSICNVYAEYATHWAVTFWNDNKIHLFSWIPEGEDMPDPEEYFDDYTIPTKESTAQYNYTFSHWEGDFENITEPRNYIAVYTSVVRRYSVHFYNGDTLLQTVEDILYDGSATYTGATPTKLNVDNPEEYVFKGWSPLPESIQGETICRALFRFTGYLKDDWATIAENVSNGTAADIYQIGARKEILFDIGDTSYTADVEVIAYNHDNLADGSGKAVLTFFCKDLPDLMLRFNSTNTNVGGWEASEARAFCNGDLFNAFPEDLKAAIKEISKITDGGIENKTLVTTTDKVFIASRDELAFGEDKYHLLGQGEAYSLTFNNSESRKKYISDGTTAGYITRSSYLNDNSKGMVLRVTASGGSYNDLAFNQFNIAFGFCI